jgi:hypothetical protein
MKGPTGLQAEMVRGRLREMSERGTQMQFGWVRGVAATVIVGCCGLGVMPAMAQGMGGMKMGAPADGKKLPSPAVTARVMLDGKALMVKYNSPSMRGRKIVGELVPYGKVWRTGANPATTFVTATDLKIGNLMVPAGTYTIYTLPSENDAWMLIVNKQIGQWGTEYDESKDLGRTAMTQNALAAPQETMSVSFENTHGKTTELHVKWEKVDEYVTVTAQ